MQALTSMERSRRNICNNEILEFQAKPKARAQIQRLSIYPWRKCWILFIFMYMTLNIREKRTPPCQSSPCMPSSISWKAYLRMGRRTKRKSTLHQCCMRSNRSNAEKTYATQPNLKSKPRTSAWPSASQICQEIAFRGLIFFSINPMNIRPKRNQIISHISSAPFFLVICEAWVFQNHEYDSHEGF